MDYLSRRDLVHRDLAARNCLLDEKFNLKIADFGLSKHIESAYEKNEFYSAKTKFDLPIRWTPFESLKYRKFSIMSDVWSYWVLKWEIWTRGQKPYNDLEDIKGKISNFEFQQIKLY